VTTVIATPASTGRVVVALDGSSSSVSALSRGARLAAALGSRLELVTVWRRSDAAGGYLGGPLGPEDDVMVAAAEAMQTIALDAAFGNQHPSGLTRTVLEGPTTPTLLAASDGAEMLVLGSRGRGGFAGLLLGSVSAACAAHARCPVLVCHPDLAASLRTRRTQDAESGEIVVGIDGSDAAVGALRQGARFAESLRIPLHAISAWSGPSTSARVARARLREAGRRVFGVETPRWFHTSEREGAPEAVLGHASERARMLIIGHRVGSAVAVRPRTPARPSRARPAAPSSSSTPHLPPAPTTSPGCRTTGGDHCPGPSALPRLGRRPPG
jgi:nucleotide-binding universal stress UspA family protein